MLVPHLHLCNQAGFWDNAAKSGKLGHNRDIGPNTGTVRPGQTGTLGNYAQNKKDYTMFTLRDLTEDDLSSP